RFAEKVGSEERLAELYLLTLCDTAMTAPDNLSAWKDGLLRELMLRARAYFRGETSPSPTSDGERDELRDRITAQLEDAPEARRIVDSIDPRLLAQLTVRQVVRHAKLAATAANPRVALEVHCYPMKGHSELAIVAPDKPGVLAAIAGVLGANRLDVLGAILGHTEGGHTKATPGLVLDVFFVRDLKGEAIAEDDPRWPRLLGDLRELVSGGGSAADLIARRRPKSTLPPRVTPSIATEIKIHDDSTQATIVEVATRDRVGVLFAITQTLAELGLDISLAKVSTEGEKVADVFYVTRAGERLTDATERAQLIARLQTAVEDV
ncbi:MAG TPA: ACT domain-containing protein, partial [Kofleriaceae bacterium]